MKYPFRVYQTQVEEHIFWIAECPTLKGCTGQGDTLATALAELEANEQSWLELAKEYGLEIPEIPMEHINVSSGKLTLRVAPHIHQEAAELAKKQGVSLNQYINDAIVAQNARISTINYLVPEVKQAFVLSKNSSPHLLKRILMVQRLLYALTPSRIRKQSDFRRKSHDDYRRSRQGL